MPGSRDPADLAPASRYYPLVGLLIGVFCWGWYLLGVWQWSHELGCGMALATGVFATGAFHEDGFADSCDGFGGGWSAEDVLRIMKDSRLGSYGAIGLLLLLGLKWQAMVDIAPERLLLSLLLAHAGGRLLAVSLMVGLRYIRPGESSKVASAVSSAGIGNLLIAGVWLVPVLLFLPWRLALAALGVLLLLRSGCRRWFQRRLGGYTGDCLGAAEQLAELAMLLLMGAAWWS